MTNLKNVVCNETSGHSLPFVFAWFAQTKGDVHPLYTNTLYTTKNVMRITWGNPGSEPKHDKRRRISGHSGILFGVYGSRTYLEVQDQGRNSRLSGNETHDFGTHIGQGLGECPIQIPRCSEECGRGLPRLHFQRGTLRRKQQRIRISVIHVQSPSSGCAKPFFSQFKED